MNIHAHHLWDHFVGGLNGVLLGQALRSLLTQHTVLVIDFNHVTLMDASCAKTAFAELAGQRSGPTTGHAPAAPLFVGGALVVANLNANVRDNLFASLITHASINSLRHCVLVERDYTGTDTLLGKYEQQVGDTFRDLQLVKTLRAADTVRRFNLSLNAASTRLKALHTLGLCTREEERTREGRAFVYRSLT